MTTLFDALVATARALKVLEEGIATGGSTTTLIDTKLATAEWPADTYNGGTAFHFGNSASRFITDYTQAGTVTVDPTWSAPVAGDWYGICTGRYPRGLMVAEINAFLQERGDLPTVDTSSLTTVAGQLEYSLPAAAKMDLREVWLAMNTAAPYEWQRQLQVRTEWSAAGAVGNLIFAEQPLAGHKIKLVYMARHARVSLDADVINDYIAVDWLALEAAVRCAKQRLEQPGDDDKAVTALLNDLMVQANLAQRQRRVLLPMTQPTLPTW